MTRARVFDHGPREKKIARDQGQIALGGKGLAIRPLTTLFLGFVTRFTPSRGAWHRGEMKERQRAADANANTADECFKTQRWLMYSESDRSRNNPRTLFALTLAEREGQTRLPATSVTTSSSSSSSSSTPFDEKNVIFDKLSSFFRFPSPTFLGTWSISSQKYTQAHDRDDSG